MPYPIIQVPYDASEMPEALGTKPKFWYVDVNGTSTLYKEGRVDSGEHWSEKAACEIAEILGVPHAHYDLAEWRGRKGVASPSFVPKEGRLILGNELLRFVEPAYPANAMRFRAKSHSVRSVMVLLGRPWARLPIGSALPPLLATASDIFVGYLLLDVLIGNQDRHHENWGLVYTSQNGGTVTLAPSFDHASSLGRNERDDERERRLATKDAGSSVDHYARRARSAFFLTPHSQRSLLTLEAFAEAARMAPMAAAYWKDRLRSVAGERFSEVLEQIPDSQISEPARRFACKMIEINRGRILDCNS